MRSGAKGFALKVFEKADFRSKKGTLGADYF